jgi:hypothetical protein
MTINLTDGPIGLDKNQDAFRNMQAGLIIPNFDLTPTIFGNLELQYPS